jgi:hypothetical protein
VKVTREEDSPRTRMLHLAYQCKQKLFYEARSHCRHKTKLDFFLKENFENLDSFKNKSFQEIFLEIQKLKRPFGSIGNLTLYDIASDIVRFHGSIIDKVYIIGNGPVQTAKKYNLTIKKEKSTKLNYVEISEVVSRFPIFQGITDGDLIETCLCIMSINNLTK